MNVIKDKLSPTYECPFSVVGKTKDGNYFIRDLQGFMCNEPVPFELVPTLSP